MKEHRLIVGLDYGTTYTGVSFCEVTANEGDGQPIEVIHDWPSRHTKIGTKEKVPSEIAYLTDEICWGSNIPPHLKREMWTKLELDNHHVGEVAKIAQELSSAGPRKKPVDIVADFLAQVKAHLITNLDNRFGPELWRTLSLTLVVTVPAVWSDLAKHRTLQAIDKAGFNLSHFPRLLTPIVVTTEPEAAAIYTMRTLRGTAQNEELAVGDGFIVCDMGGGTVDLISYKIKSLEPTVIEEATIGSGAQCGGSFVDRAFLQWLESRLGTTDFIKIAGCRSEDIPRISLSKKAAKILQDFILEVKTGFSGVEVGYLNLPPPLSGIGEDDARGIVDGEIAVEAEDTMSMFETCISRTYELLNEQLQRARDNKVAIKYVFLVGGFSESPYMYAKIKDNMAKRNITTIRPTYAWSAVARGAAAKGLESERGAVLARKSRRHYGTSCSEIFNPRKHREADAVIGAFDGEKRANHQMKWLVAKGENLIASETKHVSVPIRALFWPGESRCSTLSLFACDTDDAPQRSTDFAVYRVATLNVDLSDVPLFSVHSRTNAYGQQYSVIGCDVNISLQSSLEFFVTVDGKKYGSLTAEYE